jgi:hypothetical protein
MSHQAVERASEQERERERALPAKGGDDLHGDVVAGDDAEIVGVMAGPVVGVDRELGPGLAAVAVLDVEEDVAARVELQRATTDVAIVAVLV